MILNINNKNIICGPEIKICVFWFESNQWLYTGHSKVDSSLSAIPKKRFAPRKI